MNKLAAATSVAGILSAGGSGGHGVSPAVPPGSAAAQNTVARANRSAGTGTAPAGWAATATQAFNLANAADLGAVDGSTALTVRVGLALHNVSQLQQLVANGQIVDDGTFMAQYAPTQSETAAVAAYLQSQGFSNVSAEPNNVIVSATGTVAMAQRAFNTALHGFSQSGATVLANVTPAYVPQSLGATVTAVLGLNTAQTMKATPKATPCIKGVSDPCLRFYDPSTYQIVYNAGGVPAASNTSVAIMTEGALAGAIGDFRFNEQKFGLPAVPISTVQVGLPSPDTAGATEWTLDMTYSTGMAGNVRQLYLYNTTSLTDSDIALMYNRWVTDNKAPIGNSSFGGCEFGPYLDGSMVVMDMALLQGAAHGQTMFVSSGDSGGFCSVGVPNGVPAGAPFVEYPASSPYVVAVGGTDLFSNADGSYKGETSWEAGGGGLSQFEYSPYWEAWAQPLSAQGQNLRGVPDIALDASLETGADLWLGGSEYITGGTSLASPLAAGAYARMQSAHGNRLGFGAVPFYKIYKNNPAASATLAGPPPTQVIGGFHDILAGSNGPYTALPRYDYTTGLGSFDITRTNAIVGQ